MTHDWLSPPHVLKDLGPFDLDPCATGGQYAWRPWETAKESWTWGGLDRPWHGLVWLNPPYDDIEPWMGKLADYGRGMSLTFARTSADWFFKQVWERAGGLFFIRTHLFFHYPNGERARHNGGAGSVLSAFGDEALRRLANTKLEGHLVFNHVLFVDGDGKRMGTWREAVEAAVAGRTLHIRDIYAAAEAMPKVQEAKAAGHNWRAQLRRTLQFHFQPVAHGVWKPA